MSIFSTVPNDAGQKQRGKPSADEVRLSDGKEGQGSGGSPCQLSAPLASTT